MKRGTRVKIGTAMESLEYSGGEGVQLLYISMA